MLALSWQRVLLPLSQRSLTLTRSTQPQDCNKYVAKKEFGSSYLHKWRSFCRGARMGTNWQAGKVQWRLSDPHRLLGPSGTQEGAYINLPERDDPNRVSDL